MRDFAQACIMATVAGVMLAGPLPASAASERGRLLYENHCVSCHESTVHIRGARKAANPAELRAFIQRWSTELKLDWREGEVSDVYEYLNSRYYRFKPWMPPR